MDQTSYRKNILNQIYSELCTKSLVKNKKDFANKVKYDYCCMSSALNGNPKYLTDKLFNKVFMAFKGLNPEDYPLSPSKPDSVSHISADITKDNVNTNSLGQINRVLLLLEQQQQLTANSQLQIDKMIKSIDRLVEQICKISSISITDTNSINIEQ